MSAKQSHRQSILVRKQITAQYAEQHALSLSGRNLEDELTISEHKVARLERQLASVQAELQATQAALAESNAQRDAAQADAARQQKRAEADHACMMQAWHSFRKAQKANGKLSKVIRLALTPAQYHEYRAQID